MTPELYKFQERIGVKFQDCSYLQLALSHRSVGNNNNERLEFLGDAILGMKIAEQLFVRYTNVDEGSLSRYRSALVRKETLAELAKEYGFGAVLILGESELKSGSSTKDSILADAFEAVIGAIFLDLGFEVVGEFIRQVYDEKITNLPSSESLKDSKSRLQELLQASKIPPPLYTIIKAITTHPQQFEVSGSIESLNIKVFATALSRKKAEQAVASQLLQLLNDRKI